MNREAVAVIILTYNRYFLAKKAIYSVLCQKNIPFHIYIFDNHSQRSLYAEYKNNPLITYVRHSHNIGFARNFYFAMEYILKRKHEYSFLLGDDDMVAYPHALFDLFQILKKDKNAHVVRGGFVKFTRSIMFPTQTYVYSKKNKKTIPHDQIKYALQNNITFYSGLLFKNKLFKLPKPKTYDLVSPFLIPLFVILKKKMYRCLKSKITIMMLSNHNQLATQIYNEQISNNEGISRALIAAGRKAIYSIYIHEFINYKIYSNKKELITKYYKNALRSETGYKKFVIYIIYFLPKKLLCILKSGITLYFRIKAYIEIIANHRYLLHNNPCLKQSFNDE